MAAKEFLVRLTLVSAAGLPKTDRFSKIDPYFKIVVSSSGAPQVFQTTSKDDDESPVWNQQFHPHLAADPSGFLAGSIQLSLFDSDTFSDSLIAEAVFQLASFTPQQLRAPLTLQLVAAKDKYSGGAPTVTIRIDGLVQSFNSLRAMLGGMPGYKEDPAKHAAYIPIQESQGLLYVGVEYESTGQVDIKLFKTHPGVPIFLDLVLMGQAQYTKVRRRIYDQPHVLAPGLAVYEELKLDDLSITLDFNALSVIVFDRQELSSTNSDAIVTRHGWKGALNFGAACRVLHGVEIDHRAEEIYMPVDEAETMLLVDYDADDADIKLAVLATPSTAGKGYDLRIRKGSYNKMSELYNPPIPKLGGRFLVSRIYELDDLPYGTRFSDIEICRYSLSNPRQYSIQALTRIMG